MFAAQAKTLLPSFRRLAVQSSPGEMEASMWDESLPDLIPTPDLEAIVANLRKRAEQLEVTLPTDVALYIAQNVRSNEHALELALIRLIAHSSVTGTAITLTCTQRVLKNFIDAQARKAAVNSLPDQLSQRFGRKEAKIKLQDSIAADKASVLCLLEGRDGRKTRRVRNELEVNMRESERQRLARRDTYERALERLSKKQKQG
jgi:hypothetical protein